jgi:sporulation protein YlmC with PRC-barrel domain
MRAFKLGSTLAAAVLTAAVVGSGVALAQAPPEAPGQAPAAKPDYPALPPSTNSGAQPGAAADEETAPAASPDKAAGAATGSDLKAADLVGLPVVGSDGKSIGQVATVNSSPDGKVKDIEVKTGAILGFGGSNIKVPADKVVTKGDGIQLSMTMEEFKKLKTQTN